MRHHAPASVPLPAPHSASTHSFPHVAAARRSHGRIAGPCAPGVLAAMALLVPGALPTRAEAAGPNAGGTLIVHAEAGLVYCNDEESYCGRSSLLLCEDANTRVDQSTPHLLYVFAAFPESASPRLNGVTFGIDYEPGLTTLVAAGGCGDFELATPAWPAPSEGTAVTWGAAQTDPLVEVYCFAAYAYYSGLPTVFRTIPHPTQGGSFADDSVPAILDPIAGYGSLGFYADGLLPCPDPGALGACCLPRGDCAILVESYCAAQDGEFQGEDSVCTPNPCPPCIPFALDGRPSATRPAPAVDLFAGEPTPIVDVGPHRGGTLVLHIAPDVVYTDEGIAYCDDAEGIETCADIVARTDREEAVVVHAIALFAPEASPRLTGLTFGIDYTVCVEILDWGACGDFELTDGTWPAPASGTAVTWATAQTGTAVPVYWFAAQALLAEPGELSLVVHPTQGAMFADDSVPARLDPIAALGTAGFYRDGSAPCPSPYEDMGACCFPDESCAFLTSAACTGEGGDYQGDEVPCVPDLCLVPPPTGACCLPDGTTCLILEEPACDAADGAYLGADTACEPNPCLDPFGACCVDDLCTLRSEADCLALGGFYFGAWSPCRPGICFTLGCGDTPLRLTETGLARDPGTRLAHPPASSVGAGRGTVDASARGDCGIPYFHADGSYENGYAWMWGGTAEPCFGAFAEGYGGVSGPICSILLDLTQVGYQAGQVMDVYLWGDAGDHPGAVLDVKVGIDPGPVAYWPELSRHVVAMDGTVTGSAWWVGYWGNWPDEQAGWFIGVDTNGFGGHPYTNIAPGIGYPTGWQDVSVVWGPTQSIGIGAEVALEDAGACCYPDGSCALTRAETCTGVFQGVGTLCDPNPCPTPPSWACCFANGTCLLLSSFACADEGGTYQGDDVTCEPNPCPQPTPGACCYPGGTCLFVTSFDCTAGDFLGEGTSCDPNPCDAPSFGACCLGEGRCEVRLASTCEGDFLGEETNCSPNPCPPVSVGACCFSDGRCELLARFACAEAHGTFLEDSDRCDPNPCPTSVTGACCFADATCLVLEEAPCLAAGGNFGGVGVACAPNPCPAPALGACCLALGDCTVLTQSVCAAHDGVFLGDDSVCTPNPCPQPCEPFALNGRSSATRPLPPEDRFAQARSPFPASGPNRGGTLVLHIAPSIVYTDEGLSYCQDADEVESCANVVARTDREEAVVVHALALFAVETSPRLLGLTFGIDYPDCVQLLDWEACGAFELSDGSWPAPGSGTAVTWDAPQTEWAVPVYWFAAQGLPAEPGELALIAHPTQGALFADDSVPSRLDPIAALGSAGFFRDGATPCPVSLEVTGACCFADGSCAQFNPTDCAAAGGTHVGDEVSCTPDPCPAGPPTGACCAPESEACVLLEADVCAAGGGTYLGDDTVCVPNPCVQTSGACCLTTGACHQTTAGDCAAAEGVFLGDGSACDPDPCPPTGACCFENSLCVVLFAQECAELGGVFQGADVPCEAGFCPTPGACCIADGSCFVVQEEVCEANGGSYLGDGAPCDPNPCPQPIRGACCFANGACTYISPEECASAGGDYLGDGSPCNPNPCPQPAVGACCYSDGRCRIRTADDCATQGGVYQGDNTLCTPNPCPQPTGACCFPGQTCLIRTPLECEAEQGDYQGNDVLCDPNPCPVVTGACCMEDLTCRQRSDVTCMNEGGTFLGDGIPCSPNPCCDLPAPAPGAGSGPPRAEVGPGSGRLEADSRGDCGTFTINADGSYENGFAWQFGGTVAPYYGAFAECYATPSQRPCSITLDLTQIGGQICQVADVYAWADAGGAPGAVLVVGRADPGPIAFWPSVSRHTINLPSFGHGADGTWVGYWGVWPGDAGGWFVGADTNGFGGCPYTNIAPGIGYPTGWNNVSVVWGPTQALGIGCELVGGAIPVQETSWGQIKALFR